MTSVPVTSTAARFTALSAVSARSGLATSGRTDAVVGLADLDVEQHRQPHHRHRCQQVDGHRPPQQPGAHGDAADHRLHDRRQRHQPRIDQDLGTPARPGHRQHGQRRGDHHRDADHPVAELDRLMDSRHLGDRYRGEAARKALRPGRTTQPRRGDADDRAGDGDPALGEDDGCGDDPLDTQAGLGKQVHQPQQQSSDGHRPIVSQRKLHAVVTRVPRLAAPRLQLRTPARRVVCLVAVS